MPRRFKNFKIRPAKFLGAHHTKYQTTGTYTGTYRGPPVSDRRLAILNGRSRNRHGAGDYGELPDFINSPISKGRPLQQGSAERNSGVFLFKNSRTKQVVYSLTGHLEPEHVLPQLTFYGKKTVPTKYRKDDWRPIAAIDFRSPSKALLCYWYLRDLRMLRDYAWRKKGEDALPKKIRTKTQLLPEKKDDSAPVPTNGSGEKTEEGWMYELANKKKPNTRYPRAAHLMDQGAAAICDSCTAIEKVSASAFIDKHDLLVQWKVVEDLANEASFGALNVLRKQIARGQRVLNNKKKEKKFPNPESRTMLQKHMRSWYRQQTMMYKAIAAVKHVREAERAGQDLARTKSEHITDERDLKHSYARRLMTQLFDVQDKPQQMLSNDSHRSFKPPILTIEHPSFTAAHGIEVSSHLTELREEMKWIKYWQSFPQASPHVARLVDLLPLEKELASIEAESPDILAVSLMSISDKQLPRQIELARLEAKAQHTNDDAQLLIDIVEPFLEKHWNASQSPVTIFWSSLTDRKHNAVWPDYVTHTSLGFGTGGRQYYVKDLSVVEQEAEHFNEGVFYGNEDNDTSFSVEKQAEQAEDKIDLNHSTFKDYDLDPAEQNAVREYYWQFIDSTVQQHIDESSKAKKKRLISADLLTKPGATGSRSATA